MPFVHTANLRRLVVLLAVALVAAVPGAARADAALVTRDLSFVADDGVVLHASVGGDGSIAKRPLIVEDSPYAPGIDPFAGTAYNYVELQWRGTGLSGGALSTTGSRDQRDLAEFLGWACQQPWSDGRIGLYGFSASAIVAYNAMRLGLPCVKGAALMAGTVDLYRDLLYIGGINNSAPGGYVEGAITAPWLGDLPGRAQQQPASIPSSALGLATAPTAVASHMTEDSYWLDRTFQGDPQQIPILADTGFYDVESRGPFLAYRATRGYGSHLLVMGAHDGWPSNTAGPFPQYTRWFDHYVRGVDNGIDREPPVSLYLSNGSHKQLTDGHWTQLAGSNWPLPGTSWTRLYLSPAKSGSASSVNDGSLALAPPRTRKVQSYPFTPSDGLATDPHTVSTISGAGGNGFSLDGAATYVPALTDMQLAEPISLTYTLPKFKTAVNAVGPVGLDVWASSSAPVTDLVAILADVAPDGTANAVASGQLRTSYPRVDRSLSLLDPRSGDIVDPYADFSGQDNAAPGSMREYHLEILPIGNHFAAGHSLRLYLVGTSIAQQGAPPAVDSVATGATTRSRLLFPTVGASPASATRRRAAHRRHRARRHRHARRRRTRHPRFTG